MVAPTDFVWMDGKLVPWDQARVHVLSHSLHYGYGAFEGIRAYETGPGQGAVFRLREHAERLVGSARILNLKVPYDAEQVAEAVTETFVANRMTEGYARPLIYVGTGGMGLFAFRNPVHLSVAVWEWGAYLGDEGRAKGIRACTSSFGRISQRGFLPKGKIPGHYVNSILAKEEAIRNGYDEGLLCDELGNVVEGSGENLFLVRKGRICTPPLEANILGGVTRDAVIALATDMGIAVEERLFGRDSLYLASEVFLTGTAAEVTPVREIDGRAVGGGTVGPVTARMQAAFDDVVRGRGGAHPEWRAAFSIEAR